jgi:hypothetical protein
MGNSCGIKKADQLGFDVLTFAHDGLRDCEDFGVIFVCHTEEIKMLSLHSICI